MFSDSVAESTKGVKLIKGGTSVHVPPPGETFLDALSTRPCVRLRMWVVGGLSHEEFRTMVRGVERIERSGSRQRLRR